MNSKEMERKEEVVEPVKTGSGNDSGRQPASRQQSRFNLKLLKRSHAIKESTSPPPDIYEVNTNHDMSAASPEVDNNNSVNMNKNERPVTPENNVDSNWTGCIPKGNHGDQASVQTVAKLEKFITNFLQKSSRDRQFLLKLESDFTECTLDAKKNTISFGIMTSYERMIVHRIAEYFGMDHKVDPSGNTVIVTKSKNTRLPTTRFKQLMRDDSPLNVPQSILKRDSASFEDTGTFKTSDRHGGEVLQRSKSYEEREEQYEKARKRIFHQGNDSQDGTKQWVEHTLYPEGEDLLNAQPEQNCPNGEEHLPNRCLAADQKSLSHLRLPRLIKGKSYETKDTLKANSLRSSISKSYSFGGYDQNANARVLTKQDSCGSSMSSRVSPLSSGYKSQSLRSDTVSATPSPSVTPHFTVTVPSQNEAASEEDQPTVLWAVTKIESVPVGSVLINPQTGLETQPEIKEALPESDSPSMMRQMPETSHPQGAPPDQPYTFRPEVHQQPYVGSAADMCGYMMGLNLNDRGRSEPVRRHQTYYPSSHLQVPQNVVNPMMTAAAIVPRTNDCPTFYRIVYNTGGGLPMMFNTPPPSLPQPPAYPVRFGHNIVPATHSGAELNFPPPPAHAFYQYTPNMQVVAPTPSFVPSIQTRVPTTMMGYVPMPTTIYQNLPIATTQHTAQNSNTHFPVYTNHAPPVQSFPQYQAGSLPRPPVVRGSRMQQGPWS